MPLGTVVSPTGKVTANTPVFEVGFSDGKTLTVSGGDLKLCELGIGEQVEIEIRPLLRNADVGAGPGEKRKLDVRGGHAGLILDGRGRPIQFPVSAKERTALVAKWAKQMGLRIAGVVT